MAPSSTAVAAPTATAAVWTRVDEAGGLWSEQARYRGFIVLATTGGLWHVSGIFAGEQALSFGYVNGVEIEAAKAMAIARTDLLIRLGWEPRP